MEVILTPENEAALRSYIHEIITDEIAKARRDASVDKRVLKQIEIAKYFGVSTATITFFALVNNEERAKYFPGELDVQSYE